MVTSSFSVTGSDNIHYGIYTLNTFCGSCYIFHNLPYTQFLLNFDKNGKKVNLFDPLLLGQKFKTFDQMKAINKIKMCSVPLQPLVTQKKLKGISSTETQFSFFLQSKSLKALTIIKPIYL